jgi:L-cysteine desulfidase
MFTVKEFLSQEVRPALGCTEPGAVALAVARAGQELPSHTEDTVVRVIVSASIYKNGVAVSIPGVKGARGNKIAAALAIKCGCADYGLEVLKDCLPQDVKEAVTMVERGQVQIVHDKDHHGVYVEATITSRGDSATCVIDEAHTNIVKVIKNGCVLFQKNDAQRASQADLVYMHMAGLTYADLFPFIDSLDTMDEAYLMEGVRMNKAIAEAGLRRDGATPRLFAKVLQELAEQGEISDDLGYRIRAHCYAASDVRMAGGKMPVMSSAGSGNHGITAILPVV